MKSFVFSIVVFVIIRLILVFFFIDSTYLSADTYRTFVVNELIEGPKIPLLDYAFVQRGTIRELIGITFLPVFAVLGSSYLVTKISILILSTAIFILWIYFINRYFDKETAFIFSLLFCFSPTPLLNGSLILEHYFLILLFIILGTILWFRIYYEKKFTLASCILLGATCGLGIWYLPVLIIYVFYLLLWWFIIDKKLLAGRHFYIFLISMLIFLFPCIHYNLTHDLGGLSCDGGMIYQMSSFNSAIKRLGLILTNFLPHLFYFQGANVIFKYFLYGFFILSLVFVIFGFFRVTNHLPNSLISKNIFIVLFIFIILVFTVFSKVEVDNSYFIFLYPFMLLIISFFIQKVKYKKILFPALLLLLFYLTVKDISTRFFYYAPFQGLRYQGVVHYPIFGQVLGGGSEGGRKYRSVGELLEIIKDDSSDRKLGILSGYLLYGNNWQESFDSIRRLERRYRFLFFHAFRQKICEQIYYGLHRDFDDFGYFLTRSSVKLRDNLGDYPVLLNKLDSLIYECMGMHSAHNNNLKELLEKTKNLPEERILDICRGYGYYLGYKLEDLGYDEYMLDRQKTVDTIFNIINSEINVKLNNLPKRYLGYIYMGYMEGLAQNCFYEIEGSTHLISVDVEYYLRYINNVLEKSYRTFVYYGIGISLGKMTVFDDPHRMLFISQKLGAKYAEYLYRGMGEGAGYALNDSSEIFGVLRDRVPCQYKRYFLDGFFKNHKYVFGEIVENNLPGHSLYQ